MAANPLQQLNEQGQSVWLDYISRDLVTSGELERLIAEDSVTGLTSNPTIFQKAIAEGSDYDAQIRELLGDGIDDPNDIFLALAIRDIQRAADIFAPVHERTGGADGFVSLELPPVSAFDTSRTIELAAEYWRRVDRPNLMVKIPATPAGVPAVAGDRRRRDQRQRHPHLRAGVVRGGRRRVSPARCAIATRDGPTLDVHSVASFFVSRVDTAVDKLIEAKLAADPGNALLEGLLGKAAMANAVLAYEVFEQTFRGDGFADLAGAGAPVQRPLWASTSAKNPKYRDVVYAEALVGPDTVDTMPPSTIEAFRDHGVADRTVDSDYAGAHSVFDQLAEVGIDMAQVTADLLAAGVKSFADFYDDLIRGIAEKVDTMRGGYGRRQYLDLGASTDTVRSAISSDANADTARRIWSREPDLWKPGDAAHAAIIGNRLGWLDVIDTMRSELPRLLTSPRRVTSNLVHAGRMDQKRPLDAKPVADFTHQKRRPVPAFFARNDRAFKNLDALFAAFHNLHMDTHGVARAEVRHGFFALAALNFLNEWMHLSRSPFRRPRGSGRAGPVSSETARAVSGRTWTAQMPPRGRADAFAYGASAPCVAIWRSRHGGRRAEYRERACPETRAGACNADIPAARRRTCPRAPNCHCPAHRAAGVSPHLLKLGRAVRPLSTRNRRSKFRPSPAPCARARQILHSARIAVRGARPRKFPRFFCVSVSPCGVSNITAPFGFGRESFHGRK